MSARSAAATLAALAALAGAPGGARGAPCALELAAEPAWLDLGARRVAQVRVRGASAPPLLSASAGRLEEVRADGDGYVADYVPPAEPWPQLALVVAFDGERHGALVIPLHGHGVARVETRPGTEVRVTIGERTFGPVRTGPDGRATVPVVVAPGVREARHGRQRIPLHPPPLRRVHLAVGRPAERADLGGDILLVAAVAAEDGGPWTGEAPALEASEGELAPAGRCAPGAFAYRWRVAPGAVRVARATGRLAGGPPAELDVPLVAGPAVRVALVPASPGAAAGGAVAVGIRAEDAAGNPAEGEPTVTAAPGAVGAPERRAPGEWTVRFVAPERLEGAREAMLHVRLGDLAADATIALSPAAPAILHVGAPEGRITADGRTARALRIEALDAYGNQAGAPPEVRAEAGEVSAPVADGSAWSVVYTAPLLGGGGEDRIEASLGAATGAIVLRLDAPAPRVGVALRAGAAARRGSGAAPDAGIEVSAWPASLGGRVGLALEVGASSLSRTATLTADESAARVAGEATLLSAGISIAGTLRRDGLSLWLGAGPGAALARTRVVHAGVTSDAGSTLVPEAHAALSLGLATSRGTPFAVVRLSWLGDLAGTAFEGPLRTASFGLGWRLDAR